MENSSKINSIMKLLVMVMLGLYLTMYIVPFGPIYGNEFHQEGVDEDAALEDGRMTVTITTGTAVIILMIVLHILRKSEILMYALTSFGAGIVHMNLLISGITMFIKFDHYLEHKMAGVLMKTGIILYALIAIANVALIAVAVVRLADYIKNKKQYDEHNEFVEVYNVMDISPKSRDIRDKMNVLCIWIAVLVLVLLSLSSIMYVVLIGGLHPDLLAGVPSTVIGYAVPIALCFIMIVSNWIKRGKWLPVVLSYLVFWYIVYDIIFYMFSDQVLVIYYPLLVVLQNIDFTEAEARIIIWIVACICIGVVTIVNGIYGILDKREK